MRYLIFFLLIFAHAGYIALPASASTNEGVPRVVVEKRRLVIVRTGKIVRQFPERKRAVINYPVVRGPLNSEVLRKVRALLDYQKVFETTLAEYKEEVWLTEIDYEVNYNQNYILDITFRQEGTGAYPATNTKHFAINLRTGELIRAADAFNQDSLSTLASMVDKKLKAEIQETMRDAPEARDESMRSLYEPLKFEESNLSDFSVSAKGITFLYEAGFPHAVQALAPNGQYFFSYAELKPYIKRDGPLGVFIK